MSKKTNTLWFILGATVFNILITIIMFIILFVVYAKFLLPLLPESVASWGFVVIFLGAIALSFVVYRLLLKFIMKKVNVEQHFDPLFGSRRGTRKIGD
jgi:hypothetical protein